MHSAGGGGAGYGGPGGDSALSDAGGVTVGAGGPTYGTDSGPDIAAGSGGGSGGNHCDGFGAFQGSAGGAGGAAITLSGEITLTGSILADGADGVDGNMSVQYGDAAGGGGSGGGILLNGVLTISGTLSAHGGNGGDASPQIYAEGGGGGGGGRIKLTGTLAPGSAFSTNVLGGSAGTSTGVGTDAVAGGAGVVSNTTTAAVTPPPTAPPTPGPLGVTPAGRGGCRPHVHRIAPRQPVRGRRDPPAGLGGSGIDRPVRDPFLLETSLPGVFAVGDVRHGSVKRVAAAVGDGSVVIQFLHQLSSSPISAIRGVARRKPPAHATPDACPSHSSMRDCRPRCPTTAARPRSIRLDSGSGAINRRRHIHRRRISTCGERRRACDLHP